VKREVSMAYVKAAELLNKFFQRNTKMNNVQMVRGLANAL